VVKVGVIIPARNAVPWIGEMLDSIKSQTHPAHVYIAEDRSDDGTHEWLREHPDLWAGLRRNRVRKGWAGSLNAAAALALADGCDALFTASADDRLHADCIARCVAVLGADGGHDFVVPWAQQFGEATHVQASLPDCGLDDLVVWPPLIDKALIRREVWRAGGRVQPEGDPARLVWQRGGLGVLDPRVEGRADPVRGDRAAAVLRARPSRPTVP
jgi:glycosyltransferase involved in cell wall biosynthesis